VSLVPNDFEVPSGFETDVFILEPLDARHNAADYRAWTSSIVHIRATAGFEGRRWPDSSLTIEDNERDLARHADDFTRRAGFTYTVLDPSDLDVIGCVYVYPARTSRSDVEVRSWVRADKADLDRPLYEAVRNWLITEWPFHSIDYAPRTAQ
jgi:hypothetical protein